MKAERQIPCNLMTKKQFMANQWTQELMSEFMQNLTFVGREIINICSHDDGYHFI